MIVAISAEVGNLGDRIYSTCDDIAHTHQVCNNTINPKFEHVPRLSGMGKVDTRRSSRTPAFSLTTSHHPGYKSRSRNVHSCVTCFA